VLNLQALAFYLKKNKMKKGENVLEVDSGLNQTSVSSGTYWKAIEILDSICCRLSGIK
jgi:hypothetical protein